MKDGRSKLPSLPAFLRDENVTETINKTLGTPYTMEQIDDAPELWIEKMMMYARARSQ